MSKKLTKAVKERRQQILDFEATLLSMQDNENVYLGDDHKHPLTHVFTEGLYLRELRLEADTTVVGKIHKEDHIIFYYTAQLLLLLTQVLMYMKVLVILNHPQV